jgi:Uri superfamily endonuclease
MNAILQDLPKQKGTYIIYGTLQEDIALSVGVLGMLSLPAGSYVYVGSALGSGGIRARVNHHLTPSPKTHWHFDYLQPHITIQAVLWQTGPHQLECEWVHRLIDLPGVIVPTAGFGASDCRSGCPAHLLSVRLCPASIAQHLQIDHLHDFMYNNEALPQT